MKKYKVVSSRSGYEHVFRLGDIVEGVEQGPEIESPLFTSDPLLCVFKDGKQIARAHLSRFEEVKL